MSIVLALWNWAGWQWAGWQALTAIGTTGSVVVALGIASASTLAARRSWRKVQTSAVDRPNYEARVLEGTIRVFNGSSRTITDVTFEIDTPDALGDVVQEENTWFVVPAGDTRSLELGQNEWTLSGRAVLFTDWYGRRFRVDAGKKPTRVQLLWPQRARRWTARQLQRSNDRKQ